MDRVEIFKMVAETIIAVVSALGIGMSFITALRQDKVSFTVLSHEKQEKSKAAVKFTIFAAMVFMFILFSELMVRERTPFDPFTPVPLIILLIVIVIEYFVSRGAAKALKEADGKIVEGRKRYRGESFYVSMRRNLFCFMLCADGVFFVAMSNDYWNSPRVLRILLTVSAGFVLLVGIGEANTDIKHAELKFFSEEEGRYLYLFCLDEDMFSAGDRRLMEDCTTFFYLTKEQVGGKRLLPAGKDDALYIEKTQIEDGREDKSDLQKVVLAIISNEDVSELFDENNLFNSKIVISEKTNGENVIYSIGEGEKKTLNGLGLTKGENPLDIVIQDKDGGQTDVNIDI